MNKVTKKIERWHDEKSKQFKEQFENDEEFIEHEQSPTNFETSSDEEDVSVGSNRKRSAFHGYDGRASDGGSYGSSSRKGKLPKSNQQSFKLSLLETGGENSKAHMNQGFYKNDDEEAEFIEFLKN